MQGSQELFYETYAANEDTQRRGKIRLRESGKAIDLF